jgi:DNA topoisomerase-1
MNYEILEKLFNNNNQKGGYKSSKNNTKKSSKNNTKKSSKNNTKKSSKNNTKKSSKNNTKKSSKNNTKKSSKQNSKKQRGGNYKWTTLEHNGVLFSAEYVPHLMPLKYNNQYVQLTDKQEEAAMFYAKYLNTDYTENRTFNKNFWNDLKKLLGKNSIIQNFEDCDFTEYKQKILEDKIMQKAIILNTESVEDDNNSIDSTQSIDSVMSRVTYNIDAKEEEKYKTAIVDGVSQPVGNYRIEPPGIFLGRGDNPQIGKIKPRIQPEDIIINIGKEAKIPETLKGHKWGKVIHDRSVEWLASWKDLITGKTKYLWLGAHSHFKAASDVEKFDLAKKLKRKIESIREENTKNLESNDIKLKQIATAFYFIDNFALRVGGEKGEDDTDTVGVTTLRIEHIELLENNTIGLDFLGKDSVRYYNKLSVIPEVYKNIIEFIKDKTKNDELFDFINSIDINKYLQTFMKDLTAKVFRTYNASYLFQKELKKITNKYENSTDVNLLVDEYNKANVKVAKLMNHQKDVGKSFKPQLEKIDTQIKKIKSSLRKAKKSLGETKEDRVNKLTDKLKKAKVKKELKQDMKNISLGTSKQNYLDPRITVAFSKKHNIPIDKLFNKALQTKFQWAMESDADYRF